MVIQDHCPLIEEVLGSTLRRAEVTKNHARLWHETLQLGSVVVHMCDFQMRQCQLQDDGRCQTVCAVRVNYRML